MVQNILSPGNKSKSISYLVTDIFVIIFIYLLPSLSHLTSIPFYLFEPMRLALVFCIIHTNRKNSLIVALTLPVISLIISSHPVFIKSIIITSELVINVLAFFVFSRQIKNLFIAMFLSIFAAKIFYYSAKIIFINYGLIQDGFVSTPLWIQGLVMLVLSAYTITAFSEQEAEKVY